MPIPLKFKAVLDDSAFMAGIRRIKTASSKLGGRMGAGAGALGRGGAGLVGGIGAAAGVRNIANQADALYNLSRKTGMTTTSLAALAEMGKGANIEIEQLAASVVKMQAAMGTKTGQDAIKELGLNLEEIKAMKPEEQFQAIGSAIGAIADQNKKIELSKGIFQRGGSDMFELFDDLGKLDMSKVSQNAKQMGEAAKPIADAMDKLGSFGVGVAARGATMMKQLLEGDIKGLFSKTPAAAKEVAKAAAAVKKLGPLSGSSGLNALAMYPQTDPFNRARHVPTGVSFASVANPDALGVGRKEEGLSGTKWGLRGASGLGIYGTGNVGTGGQAYGKIARGDADKAAVLKAAEDLAVIRKKVEEMME